MVIDFNFMNLSSEKFFITNKRSVSSELPSILDFCLINVCKGLCNGGQRINKKKDLPMLYHFKKKPFHNTQKKLTYFIKTEKAKSKKNI